MARLRALRRRAVEARARRLTGDGPRSDRPGTPNDGSRGFCVLPTSCAPSASRCAGRSVCAGPSRLSRAPRRGRSRSLACDSSRCRPFLRGHSSAFLSCGVASRSRRASMPRSRIFSGRSIASTYSFVSRLPWTHPDLRLLCLAPRGRQEASHADHNERLCGRWCIYRMP